MGYELFKEWEREEKVAEADRKHGYGQNYYESESGVTPYDYTHTDAAQQQAPAMQTEVQPYLANVRNVLNLKTQYDADPNFSDPFAPRQAVDDTYTYLSKTKYKDIPVENWTDLDASDVFYREYLSKMAQPVKQEPIVEPVVPEFIPQNEAQKAILEGDKNRHVRDWSQLSGSDKFIYGITPSSNVATDAPEATKYTKGIVQAIPTTTVAAKAGSLFGPWGTVIGGGIGLGISAYQTFTGKQVPIAGNVLEALDKPGQWAEQGLGFITQAGKRTWDLATGRHDGSDTRMLLEVLGEMWHDRRQMWEGGKYFMETVASPLLDIPFDVIRKIGGQDWSGYGQVIDPVASDKPVDLIEGTYGIPGMENAGKLWSDLVEHGYSEQVASDMIASGMFSMGSTSWMWADLIGQEFVDPLNQANQMTNALAGKTANILKSSDTPTTKAFGDALAAAAKVNKGGLFELGDLMKDQFRTADVNTLGSWAKRMSGIDPVTGKLSELDVTDPHRKFNWYRKQAELTPESKAIDVSTKANDTLMTQTFEAQDSAQLRAVYDQLSRLDDITPGENSTIVDSAETRTIANGLRDGILNSNATIVMDQFDATVTNRNTLNAVAADLDLTPEKVYDMLRNDPDVFTRRVNEYATAHDGKIGGVEVAAIEPQLKIYTGDKPAPYSLNEVKLLVNASVIDKMSDYYVKAYGISPDGMFNKMSNLMKDAQSILLLGASPSYAINNVVNNLVTQAAVGALGFMSPSMINDIRTRMGITPTRMGESLAEMRGTENLTGINKKIRDVKTSQNDIFDKVNKAVKQGNDTLGVFGKISRRAEQSMSDNAIAVGINQYWKKRWKKGIGFSEMPVELVALIEAQTPGMTDVIYGAIERGMNMSEIRNGIFGTYIKPGTGETVQSVIGRLFPDEAGLYDEIFVKTGLVDTLEREFKYCDTDAERTAAWNRVKSDIDKFVDVKRQIDLETMGDNFKVIFEKEGLPFVSKYMAEAAATRGDVWKRSRELWEDTYQKVSLFSVKRGTDQYKRLIAATAYEVDKAFKVANEAYSQAYKAMLEGLSVSTDENVAIIKNVLDIQDTWDSFYKQQTEMMDQYYAMVDHDPNAWAKTQAILNGLAKDAFDKEIELQTKIDNSIAEAVKKAVDGDITQLEQNMSVIRAIRERMRDWQIKTRETVADMTESERNAYYKKHNPEYNGMIQEIRDLQVQNGKIIEDNRMNAVPNRKKATVTADDTVKMQHAAQEADVIKQRAKVATQGYMDREAIRQTWVDTGISNQAVDLQMKIMDAAEERWNADNPGKNYYTEGLRIREITREVGGEHGLFQWGTIAETDIDTPQFKQAFGKTKVVDDAGNPKVVYHGSPYAFEEFNYKHKGMNGSSEGYGFYFSDDINIAEGYSKNTGNIYKTYVNIEKPLSDKSYTISKAELKKLLIALDKSDMADVESEHWFLSDYGDIQFEGFQRVLNEATDLIYDGSTNDVDMISEIINTSSPDRVYRALKQTLGYDGIITKWDANDSRGEVNIYIPFLPEQIKSVYNKGDWDMNNPNMLFQTYAAAVADGSPWYSHMETVITDKFPEKMNAQSVRNWLMKQGVTKQELQWSGMDEYLDSATGQVTKADLQRVVDMDRMKIEEVDISEKTVTKENAILEPIYDSYITDGNNNNYTEKIITLPEVDAQYQSNHWKGIDNPVFHVRFDDRIDSQGRKILFIEEFQSDWAQHLKDGKTAPLADVWERKAIQRMMNYAADGDYDMVAWAPGSEHMARYSLGAVADEITFERGKVYVDPLDLDNYENTYYLKASKKGKKVFGNNINESNLADYIGKQKADLILNSPEYQSTGKYTLTGADLAVGDTWPLKFYDQDIANATRKIVKRYGSELETTLIDTGNGNMLEVQAYKVTSGMAEPQKLFQAFQDGVKGKFEVIDGDVAIRALKAADVTTMVHETGHAFRRTLNDDQMEQFTRWAGFDSVEQFRQLEYQFQNDYKNMTEADRKRYVDSEEKFARGWEQYLIDGSAPTIGLKSVFRKFTQYMLEVYRSVKDLLTKDYSRQGEFVFDGQVLNINAEINGVKLRDIFDSMLSEKAERTPTYTELISKRINDLRADKANARLDDQTIYRKAVYGVNSDILSPHGSLDQAMQSAIGGNQPFALPDGTIIDDIALYDAIASAQSLRAYNPFGEVRAKETRGNFTTASGINDARTRYEFQYKVIDLNDVTPSHTWLGNQLLNNQEYNAALQPRSRNEFQSVMQIDKIAANLSPDMLLLDSHAIDRGSPIVGADNNVESGNGRVLALLRAKDLYPDAWANYQAELKNNVQNYGIDPESINAYENPILVRERITDMDAVDFAREANKPVALQMTAKENAIDDAKLISDVVLSNMDVLPTETITGALDAKRNAGFVTEFMKKIPDNEAAQYSYQKSPYEFVLNEAGRTRIINAIFAKVYGESADQLLKSFTMSTDSNIKAVESALKDSLPQMAKVEGLINRGSRSAEYSIANDVAIAAQKLSELRKAGVKVEDYVNQIGLPGLEMELTQVQNKLLSFFSEQRNAKKIREFLRDYAAQVENQADVDQSALFAMEPITKEFMIDRALAGEAVAENADVPSLFQMASDAYKQNNQTRFDDGSIVPDTDADNIILTGAINAELQAEYDAFLNKFENAEDRTFAQTYYDWYLSGQEGDAPKAANPFTETKVTKQAEIYADELRRYKQLYDKGVEVDPLSVQPLNGTYIKRTYAFNHGDYVIAANVYHDGKLVAYLPTNSLIADVADNKFMAGSSPEMQKVITVGDESFRVIGLDPDNPKRLVYLDDGKVRSVEPGVIDGVEPSEFAEHVVRPGKQNSVPLNMPEGYAINELKDQFITPVMNEFLNEYQKRIDSQKKVNTQGMPAETRALLNQYLDQVQSKMQAEKYRAQKYSYMKKDQAMLNYDRRYGFDSWLTMMMPYQFWYTRSMYNWANRMIDTPGIYSMYARIKEMEEKNKRETRYPTRLDGRISVYAPYLPSYFGDRIFIDPLGQLFPFSQFTSNVERIADNENQITQAAKSIIEEQAKLGFITPEEREQALTKQGGIWENAFAQAKMESGKDIGLTGLAGSYLTGPVFLDWLIKIKQGKEDQLTALPITRTGNAIRGILDDTALAGLGKIAQDALSLPERFMRSKFGGSEYHEFGSWGNGAIQKQLASMVGNGEINAETGEKAALEKDGNPHWDEAVRRAREENLYKVPSAGAVNAMVKFLQGKGSIQEIFASLALVPFGGLMYPEGERKTRDKYPSQQQAYLDKESGKNPNAVNEWYDANPDWTFRNLMFNDDPNDLLRQTMIGNLNDMYYGLPYSQQQRMKNELGPDFDAAFLNKETRNYEAIPTDQLVEWVVKSGGKIPNVPDLKVPQVQPINLYPESFANPVDEFYRIESEQYSQHKNLEKVYYALPSEQRKDFLNTFPQLSEYWAWKRSYKDQHPEVQMWQDDRSAYFNEETAINAYAEMSERTRDALRYSLLTDTKLSSAAMMELKSLYAKHANPSFIKNVDVFIKILQQYGSK